MIASTLLSFTQASSSFCTFLLEQRTQWDQIEWVFSGDALAKELELRARTAVVSNLHSTVAIKMGTRSPVVVGWGP